MDRKIRIVVKTDDAGERCLPSCPALCGCYCEYYRKRVYDAEEKSYKRLEECKTAEG